jgi:hypothetical protein
MPLMFKRLTDTTTNRFFIECGKLVWAFFKPVAQPFIKEAKDIALDIKDDAKDKAIEILTDIKEDSLKVIKDGLEDAKEELEILIDAIHETEIEDTIPE